MNHNELILQNLNQKFPDVNFDFVDYRDELTIKFDKKNIVDVCSFLKSDTELQFLLCEDITAVDWATRKNRFSVVYNLYSFKLNFRLRLKIDLAEEKSDAEENIYNIDSVCSIWSAANWYERETFDMYGINFNNHPDLRRMYMPEDFEYHPLRKDFPLMGIPGSLPLPKK